MTTRFRLCPSRIFFRRCLVTATCLLLVVAALAAGGPGAVMAAPAGESVLERIAQSGTLRAGTRSNAAPFAQRLASGGFEGFSVDLLEEIRRAAELAVGRPVTLRLSAVTPADRLQQVAQAELDIVCGITTPTWKREQQVDFSLPFFRDGTRVLVYREQASTGRDLGQLTIGVVAGTTTVAIVKDRLPTAELRVFHDMDDAMRGLAAAEVDGIANVGIVLLGLAERAEPRRSVVLLPRTGVLATEALACVLPQNDSAWRDLVNRTLVDLYAGVGDFDGRYVVLYERWFGRDGRIFYPLDRDTRDYLDGLSIWAR